MRRFYQSDEQERASKAGDQLARVLAFATAEILATFDEEIQEHVLEHLQECTSLYSPYTSNLRDAYMEALE